MNLLRSSWKAGPAGAADGPLLVSLTDYTADRFLDLPGIARAGLRLREIWPELDGAVGMWLWTMPLHRRVGSVSVWTEEKALYGFVRRPDHRQIMDRYRDHGRIDASAWTIPSLDRAAVWTHASRLLTGQRPSGHVTERAAGRLTP